MKTAISNVAPGQVVKFHGEPCIVLEHRTAGTLLVTAAQINYKYGSTNNFAASALRMHLNANFLDALTEGHPDEIITREVDLTALNGSKEYGSCECKVAPLTFDEIRRFHGLLPKPESWEWSATPWSTPCVDEDDTWVMGLSTDGGVVNSYCTNTYGSRPAFLIPSQYAVEVDGGLDQYTTNELIAEINRRMNGYDTRQWHSSNVNAYASSAIDSWLNSTYKNLLDADIRGVIGTTKIKYTPGNGNNTVGTLQRAIFLLSATELNRSASWFNVEGTALEIASSLQIAYMNGSAVVQWTRSPRTSGAVSAVYLGRNGNVNGDVCSSTFGSRPAFTLPSTLSVSDDGTVSVNTAPTITSSTANGSNLGTKTAGFNFQYTVNDVDGDTVTVKEYLDNVLKRTYTATLGQVNTFQAVTAANWQKILNGSHTLKVVANDGKADSTAYTVTFAKKVTKATVTLAAPLEEDDAISVMVMNIVGTLPADAVMEVLVTNNAKDTTPVWEDATADVKNGANHVFTNKTAANGFAFNFKLSVERGASDTGGYISNIGGAFE